MTTISHSVQILGDSESSSGWGKSSFLLTTPGIRLPGLPLGGTTNWVAQTINNRNVLSQQFGGQKSEFKVSTAVVPSKGCRENLFLVLLACWKSLATFRQPKNFLELLLLILKMYTFLSLLLFILRVFFVYLFFVPDSRSLC